MTTFARSLGTREARARHAAALSLALVTLLGAAPVQAQAAPPGLPGPPPGAGLDLPAPPGRAPGPMPPEPPIVIDPAVVRPGLPTGDVALDRARRHARLTISCQGPGRAEVVVRAATRARLAAGAYACRAGTARATLRVPARMARKLARRRPAVAVVTLRESGTVVKLPARLVTGRAPARAAGGYWSDGVLQCPGDGQPQSSLVAPNWTANPATALSTRAWIAWSRRGGPWQWVGTTGPGTSRWHDWTATPKGVSEWLRPTSVSDVYALQPWLVGPISAPMGAGLSIVGVVEAVYWWSGRPTWVWHYVRSTPDGVRVVEEPCRP